MFRVVSGHWLQWSVVTVSRVSGHYVYSGQWSLAPVVTLCFEWSVVTGSSGQWSLYPVVSGHCSQWSVLQILFFNLIQLNFNLFNIQYNTKPITNLHHKNNVYNTAIQTFYNNYDLIE